MVKKIVIGLLVVGGLVWWLDKYRTDQKIANEQYRNNRNAIIQKNINTPPNIKTHDVDGGQVLILDIPYADTRNPHFLESQKCFVWKDSTSSSMSCPHQPEIVLNPE